MAPAPPRKSLPTVDASGIDGAFLQEIFLRPQAKQIRAELHTNGWEVQWGSHWTVSVLSSHFSIKEHQLTGQQAMGSGLQAQLI